MRGKIWIDVSLLCVSLSTSFRNYSDHRIDSSYTRLCWGIDDGISRSAYRRLPDHRHALGHFSSRLETRRDAI
jgi:hypothetical protein